MSATRFLGEAEWYFFQTDNQARFTIK